MKKYSFKLIMILAAVMVITGCANQLDLTPTTSVDASTSIVTAKDVQAVLTGAYNQMGSSNLYGGGFEVYADLLASDYNDIGFYGTFQGLSQFTGKAIPISNSFVEGMWIDGYSTINSANLVLDNLDKVDADNRDQVEGEAKFIRAAIYFELVKFFGRFYTDDDPAVNPGVPLVLTPSYTLEQAQAKPSRNTVAEVYAQVIADLKDARDKLPAPSSVAYYTATTGAASALLARVYLTQNDYTNALTEADAVISSGSYKLTTSYSEEFPFIGRAARIFNTSEDIYAQQVSEISGTNALNTYYASPDVGGRGDIEFYIDWLNTYQDGDDRVNMYTDDGSGSYFYSSKFDNQFGNIKVIRLAEMYLIRAEANAYLDSEVGASPVDDLNMLRVRAKLEPLELYDPAELDYERHYELAFEGQWLWDYKRVNHTILIQPDPYLTIDALDPALVFPIPYREKIVNDNLTQNPGY